MITVIKINIEHPDIIQNYGKLLQAYTEKNSQAQANITRDMEAIISKTLFRGTTVASSSGKGNPDFFITNDAMNALLNKVTGTGADIDRFNQFVSDTYGQSGNLVEAKILRSGSQDGGIKIGSFTPTLSDQSLQYFDFISGNIIDTTKYSVINDLRKSFENDSIAQPPAKNSLPTKLKKADLSSFLKTTSPEFVKLVQADPNVRALDKILSASGTAKTTSDQIKSLVDKINDKWAKSSLDAELGRLSQNKKLFDYILETPALKSQFYIKSRLLSIFRQQDSRANSLLLHFPLQDFTSKFFGAKFDEGKIKVFLKSEVEDQFLRQLSSETASLTLRNNLADFDKSVNSLAQTGKLKQVKVNSFDTEISYLVPTGGSIPMSTGNFFGVKRKYKRPPFFKKDEDKSIPKYAGLADAPTSQFLSSEYLSLLVRKQVAQNMAGPGPVGGKPLSPVKLTYRTGRFANSIELLVNYRNRVVKYYYNPIYYVHEATSRDPRRLIESSINDIMRSRFKQSFNISEAV